MTAVIYARYSSDNQREESIEGQIRECTTYAEKNGITVVKHYIDRAYSARTANRPEFQQMVKDSERRLFDIVLVWKLDRFARDRYDAAHYKHILQKNHVKLVSATEPISDSPAGIMMESMLTGMAEYYSAELSEKIVRGMTENVLKGKYNGSTVPIGYVIDSDRHFQIDPLKAPFVVEAFKRYAEGATMKDIMNWLNRQGVKTGRNRAFTYGSVQTLLTKRRYIGENRFQDIVVPDTIPVIIEKELFDRVQEKMAKNRRAPARHKAEDDYLLTTKLFCGMCGAMMFGECGTGRNKVVHHYYKCANAKRTRSCKKKTVRKVWLEDLVVKATLEMLQDDRAIDAIVEMVMQLQDQENTTLPLLEKQLKETEIGIQNMLNAIQAGILTSSTKERLEALEAQKKELEIRIAEEKLAKPKLSPDFVRFWLTRFRKLNPQIKSHRETLVNTFVNAIYLYDDKVLLTSPYIFVYNCQRERIIVPFQRTDDQAILRMWIKSASDTVYLCSFQKNGYASGHVLRCGPCFPQLSVAANLSYPAGFSDKRRPQFLRSASPQMGAAAAPIRGHASRCNSNAANRLRFPDSVFFLLFSIFTDGRLPE